MSDYPAGHENIDNLGEWNAEMTCDWCSEPQPKHQLSGDWLCDECFAGVRLCEQCGEREAVGEHIYVAYEELGYRQMAGEWLCEQCGEKATRRAKP